MDDPIRPTYLAIPNNDLLVYLRLGNVSGEMGSLVRHTLTFNTPKALTSPEAC